MSDPVVSIVIPNFRHERFLPIRIKSILEQTFQDFEIIFLDDASPDNSVAVARSLLPVSKTRFYINSVNGRIPFKQWNRGITEAKGRYVWIAESDDFADPKFLESTTAVLDRNPSVGLVYSQSWLVDEHDAKVCSLLGHTDDLSFDRWRSDFYAKGREECANYLCLRNTIPNASACLIRKEVYIAAGMAPIHLRQCGDWLNWIRMLFFSDLYYLAEHLNYFRRHQATVRLSMEKSSEELVEVYQVLSYIDENVGLASEKREQAAHITFQRWRALAGELEWRFSWIRNQLRVLRRARRFDRSIERRIVDNYLKNRNFR